MDTTTERYITFRVLLSSDNDYGSFVTRKRLEDAFIALLTGAGAEFHLCGYDYKLSDAQIVGR
jgi:hypothetical protein